MSRCPASSIWTATVSVTPIVQGVMLQLVVLIVVPLIALATAQVYVEVRVVGEGLDLVIDADAAFGPARHTQGAT